MTYQNEIEFLEESNAIEGVYDSYSLDQAVLSWKYLISNDVLSHSVILKMHKILMLNKKDLLPNQIGYFRMIPVYIGGREAMHYSQIQGSLQAWIDRANLMIKYPGSRIENDINLHHVEYEKIHPFVDGNGRTGRMLLNFQRVKAGLPILVIKESEKHDYYEWFRNIE